MTKRGGPLADFVRAPTAGSRGRRILFVARFVPEPGSSGQKVYAFNVLAHLVASGFDVELIVLAAEEAQRSLVLRVPAALRELCGVRFLAHWSVGGWGIPRGLPVARVLRVASSIFDRLPVGVRQSVRRLLPLVRRLGGGHLRWYREPSGAERDFVGAAIRDLAPRAVIVNYAFLAPLLTSLPSATTGVVLTHDVLHRNFAARPPSDPDAGATEVWTADYEARLLANADVVVAIQPDEAELLRELVSSARVISVGTTFKPPSLPAGDAGPTCMFVGSDSTANRGAALWLVDEVWPLVVAAVPDATLHIYGGACRAFEAPRPTLCLHGVTGSLEAGYRTARVVLVPLRIGSGLKIKVVEAVVHGAPVVSTSVGLQGLDAMVAAGCAVRADAAGAFAEATIALLTDGERREAMVVAAREYHARHLSPESVYAPLVEALTG